MTEKGCDNCYYTYFDERAYPCSLCIRGVERTDQWQPSRKTKADRKTEPTVSVSERVEGELPNCKVCKNTNKTEFMCNACAENDFYKYEPQTDCAWK